LPVEELGKAGCTKAGEILSRKASFFKELTQPPGWRLLVEVSSVKSEGSRPVELY